MSQAPTLLRARLDSGATASCSGRPHVSPPHAASAPRRLSARQPSWGRQDAAQQPLQQAAQHAGLGAALCVCGEAAQCSCGGGNRWRTSRGVSQRCRARRRFAEEEPSEEEDLDALVEDSAGWSPAHFRVLLLQEIESRQSSNL